MTLFRRSFTIERNDRALIRGTYVDGTPQTLTFIGTVQPLSGAEIQNLEPASRTVGSVWIRTGEILRKRVEGSLNKADVLIYQGQRWEVLTDLPYTNNLLSHHQYRAEYRGQA